MAKKKKQLQLELPRVEHRTGNDERMTPQWMFRLVYKLGPIALDPFTVKTNPATALHIFTKEDDGLACAWNLEGMEDGIVWVNPPYSKIAECVRKVIAETRLTDRPLIMLTATRTGSDWFEQLNRTAHARVDWHGRIKFSDEESGAPFDSTLFTFGGDDRFKIRFARLFEHFGLYIPLAMLREWAAKEWSIEAYGEIGTRAEPMNGNGQGYVVGVSREGVVRIPLDELHNMT